MSLIKNVGSAPGAARNTLQRGRKVTKHGTAHSKPYSLNCFVAAMTMYDKFCKTGFSSSVHRTETVTTMGHERSVAASSIRSDQKQHSFSVRISSFWNKVLQGRHALQIGGDFDVLMCTSQSGKLAQPDVDICTSHTLYSVRRWMGSQCNLSRGYDSNATEA